MLYLASQSPRRKEILKKLGLKFRVVKSSYHEEHQSSLTPSRLVLKHAVGKAKHARVKIKKGIVLGADTLVVLKNRVLGKPKNLSNAKKMLQKLSDHKHEVLTGVALLDLSSNHLIKAVERTSVYFKKLTD